MHLLRLNPNGKPYLESFHEVDVPPYAVLSHTWGTSAEEVTFKDIMGNSGRIKPAYHKVEFCGSRARMDGLEYFWIDSCCIDKSSSTEVLKAINSMFRWYRNAKRCYVYLTDVSIEPGADRASWESAFRQSRWFTRGWTLQELLAPRVVEFFSKESQKLGDRKTLERVVHEVTGIAFGALQGYPLAQFSDEEKFQWAAKRQTLIPEDKAYSLLGIFDVFMHQLYGEGEEHALRRLKDGIKEAGDITARSSEHDLSKTSTAGVTMPADSTADCIMRIIMGGPTMPDIINMMTGAGLKIINGKRQVELQNGTRLIPTPAIRINGFEDAGIDEIFPTGGDMPAALRSGETYKREKKGESVIQSCVSFLVPANEESDVIMELRLGRELGVKIAGTLYS